MLKITFRIKWIELLYALVNSLHKFESTDLGFSNSQLDELIQI